MTRYSHYQDVYSMTVEYILVPFKKYETQIGSLHVIERIRKKKEILDIFQVILDIDIRNQQENCGSNDLEQEQQQVKTNQRRPPLSCPLVQLNSVELRSLPSG